MAKDLEVSLSKLDPTPGHPTEALRIARSATATLQNAADLNTARSALGQLNEALIALAEADPSLQVGRQLYICPMASPNADRWFQTGGEMANPYMGPTMPRCGSPTLWTSELGTAPKTNQISGVSIAPEKDPKSVAHWTCPMHPSIQDPQAGTCPLCGMDLVAVTVEEAHSGVIRIDSARRQLAGIRTAPVSVHSLQPTFRVPARVVWDESRRSSLSLRTDAWIESLSVDASGTPVRKGQVLGRYWSPDLVAAQADWLNTQRSPGQNEAVTEAARLRLLTLGLEPRDLDEILRKGEPIRSLPLRAPQGGVIREKGVVVGSAVPKGSPLLEIADPQHLWLEARISRADAATISVGDTAHLRGPQGDLTLEVFQVLPWLEGENRSLTARLRLGAASPDFRVDQWVELDFPSKGSPVLAVPTESLVIVGDRRIAFVEEGDPAEGRLVPREVQVGSSDGTWVEVRGGLQAGERLVVSGTFLVASESRIHSAVDAWSAAPAP